MCLTVSLSATVALMCLYMPKVYIIVFHPDKNVRKLTMAATYRKPPIRQAGSGANANRSNHGIGFTFNFLFHFCTTIFPIKSISSYIFTKTYLAKIF